MYLDSMFKVEKVGYTRCGSSVVRLRTWPRDRRVCRIYNSDIDVEEGDIIHARVQNHDPEHGWELDNLHGFHYDDSKPDCDVCNKT